MTSAPYVLAYLGVGLLAIGVGFLAGWSSHEVIVYVFAGFTAAAALLANPLTVRPAGRRRSAMGLGR